MAKKNSNKINLVNVVAVVVAVVAVVLFAVLPMVKVTMGEEGNQMVGLYKGFGMIFGGTVTGDVTTTITAFGKTTTSTDVVEITDVAFNTMAFVSFLLVVLGIVATLVTTFVKSFSKNKLFTLVAGALLVVGGVLMFTVKGSAITALDATSASEYFSLAYGPIVAGILAIVAGAGVVGYPYLKK